MKVDIAVCTWNRASLLQQTLESLTRLSVPAKSFYRVIVVDNNSSDNTPDIIAAFKDRLDLVALVETRQGHTHARNAAINVANSELMIWTDDDVVVDSQWLSAFVAAAKASPSIGFWGGRIVPTFESQAPAWIRENWNVLKGCYAARDLGDEAIDLTPDRLPYGANFAIRTALQQQFLFDSELGRRGDNVLGEDEIELFQRLLNAGHSGLWVPESKLEHIIPTDRATEKYVHDYFVGQGRRLRSKNQQWANSKTRLRITWLYERAMYYLKRRISPSPAWVAHLIRSGLAHGQISAF